MGRDYDSAFEPGIQEMISEIRRAFENVSREGGVSWSEAEGLDLYFSKEELAAARAMDKDRHWWELVDDPEWNPSEGVGGFTFLDSTSYPYYLAAAMTAELKGEKPLIANTLDEILCLDGGPDQIPDAWSNLTQDQRYCVRRFLELMARVDPYGHRGWTEALESYWNHF